MPTIFTVTEGERAEIYAIRRTVIALLQYVEDLRPGTITALRQDVVSGVNVKPAQGPLIGGPRLLDDAALRQCLMALLTEAASSAT